MSTNAYDAYKTADVSTADPVTLTTMLYDGAIKAIRKARMFHADGRRERFLDEAQRAHLIVGELLATLDFEKGGEISQNLASIYTYCIRNIIEATSGEVTKLDEAEVHIARIADAWKTATAQLRMGAARTGDAAAAVA